MESDATSSDSRRRRQRTGKVTVSELARRLGVSVMTVSRALNTPDKVSADLRERILAEAREAGYVRNHLAGGLASARTGIIGVLVPSFSNAVFDAMLLGLSQTLESRGSSILTANSFYDLDREEELVTQLLGWRPDGLVLAGVDHNEGTRRVVKASGLPTIEVMDLTDDPLDTVVGFSNVAALDDLTTHLIGKGYTRIGFVGAQFERDFRTRRRLAGFHQAHTRAGREPGPVFTFNERSSYKLGADVLIKVLDEHPDVDALILTNDDMAAGAMMHCLGEGIPVPGRLAIAGFNGLDAGLALRPLLTTVFTPRLEVGRTAGELLLAKLNGETTPRRVDLGYRLIEGETA